MGTKHQIIPDVSVIIPVYNAFSGKCYSGRRGVLLVLYVAG